MSHRTEVLVVETVARDRPVSRTEVCRQCRIDAALLDALIEHGVVETDASMSLREGHLVRVTRAVRVMHEFDVDVDNLALVVDLLDKLREQRREIEHLRRLAMPD